MAITRVKNRSNIAALDLTKIAKWAYASSGGTITSFVADDSNFRNHVGKTYRVHTFDTAGTHSMFFDTPGLVDVLIIAGGGQGGGAADNWAGGGGGAGGVVLEYEQYVPAGATTIIVGDGGARGYGTNNNGQDSSFFQFQPKGGGAGGTNSDSGKSGGSGGGGIGGPGGSSSRRGRRGSFVPARLDSIVAGGGGGSKKAARLVKNVNADPPDGGDGLFVAFKDNIPTYYAGGGVGGSRGAYASRAPVGGLGGGAGLGGTYGGYYEGADATYFGGGGSGAGKPGTSGGNYNGGAGYRGLVIVRYVVED